MSRSPHLGDSSVDSRSHYPQSDEKTPSGLYPSGLAGIGWVNCIKFNSEKGVVAIAILLLRLECKYCSSVINPEPEPCVNHDPPEKSSDCHQAIANCQKGDRSAYLPITLILIPTSEQSPVSLSGLERKPMRTDPCVADFRRKIAS